MRRRVIIIVILLAIISIIGVYFITNKKAEAPNPTTQNQSTSEQNNEPSTELDPELATNLDVNTQQFTLTQAVLSCSTTTVDGSAKHNCTGKIYIVPLSNQAYTPAMYKISEQTRVMHDNQLQDTQKLEELAQSKSTVTLKMADNSGDTIAEITY